MIKYYPFWDYDLLSIENWINDIAEQGYKLVSFGAFFCSFKKNDGKRVYYRARYIPSNTNINGAFFVGDLYIYHSENPEELPEPAYHEDAKLSAKKTTKPHFLIIYAYMIAAILRQAMSLLSSGDAVSIVLGIGSLVGSICFLLCLVFRWMHTNNILNDRDTTNVPFLVSHSKPLLHLSIVVIAIFAVCGLIIQLHE